MHFIPAVSRVQIPLSLRNRKTPKLERFGVFVILDIGATFGGVLERLGNFWATRFHARLEIRVEKAVAALRSDCSNI